MVKSRGVEAYLVRYDDNIRYPEHDYPAAAQEAASSSTEVYVEVVADERYAIVVILTPDFKLGKFPYVRIRWKFDQATTRTIVTAKSIRESFRSRGYFEDKFDSIPAQKEGAWKDCEMHFNGLHIDEESESSPEQVLGDLEHIGRIKIEVQCGNIKGRAGLTSGSPTEVTMHSKEVVKNNHVSLSTRYTAIADYTPPRSIDRFVPSKAVSHRPVTFGLRFRSRTSLQLLKIIPNEDEEPEAPPLSSSSGATTFEDAPTTSEKHKKVSRNEMPVNTISSLVATQQQQSAHSIKKEQRDNEELAPDDDLEIVEVRKTSRRVTSQSAQSVAPNSGASSNDKKKRALAEFRLEELDLEERELKIKRQQLELKRQMLEMD